MLISIKNHERRCGCLGRARVVEKRREKDQEYEIIECENCCETSKIIIL